MKKARLHLFVFCLLFPLTGAWADQLQLSYSPEFVRFYGEFRWAILAKDKSKILEMTCFPFASHEVGETFDEKTVRINKKIFSELNLHLYFLQDAAGEIFSSSLDPQPARQIYNSSEDFIEKNADPANPLGITTSLSGRFKIWPHSANISNLKFFEQKSKWCWSGADTSEPVSQQIHEH